MKFHYTGHILDIQFDLNGITLKVFFISMKQLKKLCLPYLWETAYFISSEVRAGFPLMRDEFCILQAHCHYQQYKHDPIRAL